MSLSTASRPRRLRALPWLLAACVAGPAAAQPEEASAPEPSPETRSIALLVDTSGSMAVNDPNAVLRQAVGQVVNGLPDEDRVSLLAFDSHARVVRPSRALGEPGSRAELQAAVAGLAFKGLHTNIPDGIERALYDLQRAGDEEQPGLIVLVTDGIIDTGDAGEDASKEAWLRQDLLPACRDAGVRIFGVAFTEAADYELLRTMAKETGGGYYRALSADDVPGIFAELEAALTAPPPPEPEPPKVVTEKVFVPVPQPAPEPDGLPGVAIGAIALGGAGLLVALIALFRGRREDEALPVTEAVLHDLADGTQLPLSKKITRIGRAPDNDLVIDSSTVSGRHALIEAKGGVYHVADLRSTNGTFVNEKKIEGETVLRRGDILRFDRFKYAFDGVLADEEATQVGFDEDKTQIRLNPWSDADTGVPRDED